tara:strand:+ start:2881 stop:4812 length:1932 start_codon:yes stop_codon:yes gene_type:complete
MSFRKILISTSRFNKKLLVLLNDFFCICVASLFALVISDVNFGSIHFEQFLRLIWLPLFCVTSFWFLGVYSSVVRYIDFSVVIIISRAICIVFLANLLIKFLYGTFLNFYNFSYSEPIISLIGWLVGLVTFSFLIIISRLIASLYLSETDSEQKVVIYGAGSAGIQLARALRVSKEIQPVAFIDNNVSLHGTYLGGIKVLHPKKLERLASRGKVDEVLIAMPSVSRSALRSLLKEIEVYSVRVRILPGLAELAQGKVLVSELKAVDTVDLLGRSEVEADPDLLHKNIKNKVVLITGAGGSIGSEIARQAVKGQPNHLIILDSNEYALYLLKMEIESKNYDVNLHSIIANVTNEKRIKDICKTFKVDTIYHSAAYKHVPLVEENPFEGVSNNIFGTISCLRAAIDSEVETFVLVSTDKAVRPTNIMGATKRFAEMILQSYSEDSARRKNTRMTMVRFGNVLGSSGSAIPLFQEQIRQGGPVTVTDPEVTRYFMSIPEAAELVIQAGAMGKGGDVFVLDMGEPVKIVDLAKRLISLSGLEHLDENNPDGDIEIIFTGLRPGEKLYEELLIGENVSETDHKQILRAEESFLSIKEIELCVEKLKEVKNQNNVVALKQIFQEVIDGYEPEEEVVDVITMREQENLDS